MIRRPPGREAADVEDQKRISGAFEAMTGGDAQREQQEDALLAELKQLNARQAEIISQMEQGQQQEEAPDQPTPPGAGPDDQGSPTAQGMA